MNARGREVLMPRHAATTNAEEQNVVNELIDWLVTPSRRAPQACAVCEGPVEPLSPQEVDAIPNRQDHRLCKGCWT